MEYLADYTVKIIENFLKGCQNIFPKDEVI